jgi:prepilin-type N-terminal cleavage/methylation domain-containing protein
MTGSTSSPRRATSQRGFTLIEALVAMVLLSIVVLQFLSMRSTALVDAAEARNQRIARELAEQYLSELLAGAREVPPESRQQLEVQGYPGFRYQFLIGEAAIQDAESEIADTVDMSMPDGATSSTDRLAWQRERDNLRRAQSRGMSMIEYEDFQRDEEEEERIPAEDVFEDVAVMILYPNVRPGDDSQPIESHFILKAKASTMAIEGLTPELAEIVARQRGGTTDTGSSAGGNPLSGSGR